METMTALGEMDKLRGRIMRCRKKKGFYIVAQEMGISPITLTRFFYGYPIRSKTLLQMAEWCDAHESEGMAL